MEQHVIDARGESFAQWLPLTEYAVKTGISLSTIRRKIKANAIQYRLEKGRYLILYGNAPAPLQAHTPPVHRVTEPQRPLPMAPPPPKKIFSYDGYEAPDVVVPRPQAMDGKALTTESLSLDRTVQMISDAFEHTLREKDERIRLLEQRNEELEERLNELKTLVRALEEKYEVRY